MHSHPKHLIFSKSFPSLPLTTLGFAASAICRCSIRSSAEVIAVAEVSTETLSAPRSDSSLVTRCPRSWPGVAPIGAICDGT